MGLKIIQVLEGFCATVEAIMASFGFLPVNWVTSVLRVFHKI